MTFVRHVDNLGKSEFHKTCLVVQVLENHTPFDTWRLTTYILILKSHKTILLTNGPTREMTWMFIYIYLGRERGIVVVPPRMKFPSLHPRWNNHAISRMAHFVDSVVL